MVGNFQSMQYNETNNGPFYLDNTKKEELKYDCELDQTEKNKFN